jgi:hypothetical protein
MTDEDHFSVVTDSKKWILSSIAFIFIMGIFLWKIRGGNVDYATFKALLSSNLLFGYYIILMIFGVFELLSGGFLLTAMTLFVKELSKIPLNIGFNAERRPKITNLTKFSVLASMTWFFGVFLVGIVTITTLDIYTIAVSLFTILIGLSTFLVPQWYIYTAIKRAKTKKLEKVGEELTEAYDKFIVNEYPHERLLALLAAFEEIDKIKEIPFNFRQGMTVVGSSVLPLLNLLRNLS